MKQNGFTLVELLVVLVILGLLLSLAPAAFDRALPGLQLKEAARDVAAALRQARGLAVRDNRDSVVIIDTDLNANETRGNQNFTANDSDVKVTYKFGSQLERLQFIPVHILLR